jgi:hypothetical protein
MKKNKKNKNEKNEKDEKDENSFKEKIYKKKKDYKPDLNSIYIKFDSLNDFGYYYDKDGFLKDKKTVF